MLVNSDNRVPLEVHLVIARAPLAWRTILVLKHIKPTSLLYMKATEHQESLLMISKSKPLMTIMSDNLVTMLHRMGYTLQKPSFHHNFLSDRRANLALKEAEDLPTDCKESYISTIEAHRVDRNDDQILAEVYQVLKKHQRALPPRGYMFSKNNHVTTKMGRLPPSPCQCCRSSNH